MKKIIAHPLFFPCIYVLWAVLYNAFGERLPVNYGLGWDGYKYADIAANLTNSTSIDSYQVMRIVPSTWVHAVFTWAGWAFESNSIITAFQWLNIICMAAGLYFMKKVFDHLKVEFRAQLLGFVLVLVNMAFLKFVFYYPVLTDAATFCLACMILYFYLAQQPVNLVLAGLLGAFTQPLLFYQAMVLLALPAMSTPWKEAKGKKELVLGIASAVFLLLNIAYFIFSKQISAEMDYTLKVDRGLIYLSAVLLLAVYFFMPRMAANGHFFEWEYWKRQFSLNRVLLAVFILLCVALAAKLMNGTGKQPQFVFSLENIFQSVTVQGVTEPLISLSAHGFYYGTAIALMLLCWREFSQAVAGHGAGLVIAFLLLLFLFGNINESRRLVCVFPWVVVFVVVALSKYTISWPFFIAVLVLNLAISRVWLHIGYDLNGGYDADGIPAWPNQKFYMNLGPWMSRISWMIELGTLAASLIALFFFKRKLVHHER